MSEKLRQVNERNFAAEIQGSSGTVLIEIFNDDCLPCHMIVPEVDKAAHALLRQGVKTVSINWADVEAASRLARASDAKDVDDRYAFSDFVKRRIFGKNGDVTTGHIPKLALAFNGEVTDVLDLSGASRAAEITSWVTQHLPPHANSASPA